jgi:hypothetical protein
VWRQQKTHDWLGERAILAGKNKDVEERNNIIQSVTGKGHINAWPGTASVYLKSKQCLTRNTEVLVYQHIELIYLKWLSLWLDGLWTIISTISLGCLSGGHYSTHLNWHICNQWGKKSYIPLSFNKKTPKVQSDVEELYPHVKCNT